MKVENWLVEITMKLTFKADAVSWLERFNEKRETEDTLRFRVEPLELANSIMEIDEEHSLVHLSGTVGKPVFLWDFLDFCENLLDCPEVHMLVWTDEMVPVEWYEWKRDRRNGAVAVKILGIPEFETLMHIDQADRAGAAMLLLDAKKAEVFETVSIRIQENEHRKNTKAAVAKAKRLVSKWNRRHEKPVGRTCYDKLMGLDACLEHAMRLTEVRNG